MLIKAVQASVSGMLPGPFAYAERWDETAQVYHGLAVEKVGSTPVVIDSESVIIKPDIALANMPVQPGSANGPDAHGTPGLADFASRPTLPALSDTGSSVKVAEKLPTRFLGTVMISAERPARDIHQVVEAIVEQLTTLPGSEVSIKLEIDAEVPSGLDRAKIRTLLENATTLGFIEKIIS